MILGTRSKASVPNFNSDFSKLDHVWNIYLNTQDILKSADQKVHVLFVLATILTASVISKLEYVIKQGPYHLWITVAFMIVTAIFVSYALSALLARYDVEEDRRIPRLVFFRHIQQCSQASEYKKYLKAVSHDEAIEDLSNQIYEASVITQKKFKNYRSACMALLSQLIVFLLLFIRLAL